MKVQRFTPSEFLAPYIREYLIIESDTDIISKTLPDTCIVMTFRYRGAVLRMENNVVTGLPASAVAGIRKSVRHFIYKRNTSNFIVVFKESGFTAFSKLPVNELIGLNISSEEIFNRGEVDEILERLSESKNHRQRVQLIEAVLMKKFSGRKRDTLVDHAILKIRSTQGLIRMNELADDLHISKDPLEKRFRAAVGSSPKQYASIVRLRQIIESYSPQTALTEVAHHFGYFDQSHFIKDFRLFTGQAPKDFFKASDFW